MTTYEWDGDRLVRAVTTREPEFSPDDVAALIASRRAEQVKRGPHGIPLAEAMDPANQFAFEAVGPAKDWAMDALHRKQELFYKQNPNAKGDPSLVFSVRRRKPQN